MAKNNQNNKKAFPVLTAVLSAFLAFGIMVLFHACGPKDDGTWMSCHYAQLTVFALALVMTALSVIALFTGRKAEIALYVLTIICAIAAAIIPGNVIHLCMMNEMRCRAVMRPSVILCCVLIIAFSLISLLTGKKKAGRPDQR